MENAIYTPSPTTISVVTYRDHHDARQCVWANDFDQVSLQVPSDQIESREDAVVVSRGNLNKGGNRRWHTVQLADGTRFSVEYFGS